MDDICGDISSSSEIEIGEETLTQIIPDPSSASSNSEPTSPETEVTLRLENNGQIIPGQRCGHHSSAGESMIEFRNPALDSLPETSSSEIQLMTDSLSTVSWSDYIEENNDSE